MPRAPRAGSPRSPDHFRLSPRYDHPRRLGRAGRGQRPLLFVLGIPGATHRGIPLVTRADRGRQVGVDDHPGPAGAGRGNSRRPIRAAPRDPHGHGAPGQRVRPRVDDSLGRRVLRLHRRAWRRRTRGRRPCTDGRIALALVLGAPRTRRRCRLLRHGVRRLRDGAARSVADRDDGLARRERDPGPRVLLHPRADRVDRRSRSRARSARGRVGPRELRRRRRGPRLGSLRRAPSGRSGSPTCARR